MKYLIILLLSVNICFAQQIKPIKQGDSAPFTGYIIDKQFEKDRRKDRELLDLERNKTVLLRELGKVGDGRVDFYKKEATEAKRELLKSQFKTVMYFVLGIAAGGVAVYIGSKVR